MSEKDIEGKKILERADKITNRLFKALYSEEDGDVIDYPTLMCALTKFSATVLLAVQELGERIDVEDDFIKTVKEVKATMGKDMKVQKIKEERDQIKLRIKENEMKIKYIEMKIKENEMKINEMKQKRDEALLRMSAQREQSQAGLDSAERKQARPKVKAEVFANAIKHDFKSKNPTTRWSDIIKLK